MRTTDQGPGLCARWWLKLTLGEVSAKTNLNMNDNRRSKPARFRGLMKPKTIGQGATIAYIHIEVLVPNWLDVFIRWCRWVITLLKVFSWEVFIALLKVILEIWLAHEILCGALHGLFS